MSNKKAYLFTVSKGLHTYYVFRQNAFKYLVYVIYDRKNWDVSTYIQDMNYEQVRALVNSTEGGAVFFRSKRLAIVLFNTQVCGEPA